MDEVRPLVVAKNEVENREMSLTGDFCFHSRTIKLPIK